MVSGVPRHFYSLRRRLAMALAVAVVGGLLAACGGTATISQTRQASGPATIRVPQQYRTIQAAVQHAAPGDLVLISPGVYHEAVVVGVSDLVLRGTDRNTVILDGQNDRANGIIFAADGDAVENLTVRRYEVNGVLFTRSLGYGGSEPDDDGAGGYGGSDWSGSASGTAPVLDGYRASYVTVYDNGLYGLYAFAARDGEFDHVYASGQPDSGLYIGQCAPCDAVVTDSTAEANRVGFEAANASGGLDVIDSVFSQNRDGVAVESSTTEQLAPQHGAVVAGNVIADNNNPRTPAGADDTPVFGYGVAVGGGSSDLVTRNRVAGNRSVGVIVTDLDGYTPRGDTVRGNALSGNGTDLVYLLGDGAAMPADGNCFAANGHATSDPAAIERALRCGAPAGPVHAGFTPLPAPPGVDYSTLPAPPAQPGMPDPLTAAPRPAVHEPPAVDLATITVPRS